MVPADNVEPKSRKAAKAAKVSASSSVETSWPSEFLALAGAFPDFPDAAGLRKGYGKDIPRERLD
jgi:hypothetical protein